MRVLARSRRRHHRPLARGRLERHSPKTTSSHGPYQLHLGAAALKATLANDTVPAQHPPRSRQGVTFSSSLRHVVEYDCGFGENRDSSVRAAPGHRPTG
jgi:hypothetical protein